MARSLSSELLASLTGAASLERLEPRALIVVERSRRRVELSLAHPLYGEVLHAGMPALRAESTRRILTNALQRTGALRSGDRVNLALWALDGDIEVDPVTLSQVAEVVLWHPGQEISDRLEDILASTIARGRPRNGPSPRVTPSSRSASPGPDSSPLARSRPAPRSRRRSAGPARRPRPTKNSGNIRAIAPAGNDQVRLAVALAEVTFWGEHRHEDAIAVLAEAAAAPSTAPTRRCWPPSPRSWPVSSSTRSGRPRRWRTPSRRRCSRAKSSRRALQRPPPRRASPISGAARKLSSSSTGRCRSPFTTWPSLDGGSPTSLRPHPARLPVRDGSKRLASWPRPASRSLSPSTRETGRRCSGCRWPRRCSDRAGRRAHRVWFHDAVGLFQDRDLFGVPAVGSRRPLGRAGAARRRGGRCARVGGWGSALPPAPGTSTSGASTRRAPSSALQAATPTRSSPHAGAQVRARSAGMPVEEALLLHAQVRIAPAPELAARLAELTHLTDSNLVSLLARRTRRPAAGPIPKRSWH